MILLAFQTLNDLQQVDMTVSNSSSSTIMVLPLEMWQIVHNESTSIPTYADNNFPSTLSDAQLQQLDKVYSNCIHPSHYLPQFFTPANAKYILQTREYCAEKSQHYITQYS
jgi:hypothetical protein